MAKNKTEIRYLSCRYRQKKKEKYCRFKKMGIKYIDYKDPDFLMRFLNDQAKYFLGELQELFKISEKIKYCKEM